MSNIRHIPGRPRKIKPVNLIDVVSSIHHPDVVRCGITTTREGEWGILVVVRDSALVPLADIEQEYEGFPVIYQKESNRLPIARPAFPSLGE